MLRGTARVLWYVWLQTVVLCAAHTHSSDVDTSKRISSDAATLQISALQDHALRLRITPHTVVPDPLVDALSGAGEVVLASLRLLKDNVDPVSYTYQNGNLRLDIDTTALTFTRVADNVPLIRLPYNSDCLFGFAERDASPTLPLHSAACSYHSAAGRIFGLGEHRRERLDYSGWEWLFEWSQTRPTNSDIMIPYYVSSAGYAVLMHQPGYGSLQINDDGSHFRWEFNATQQIDLVVMTTDTQPTDSGSLHHAAYGDIQRQFAGMVGRPPMPPAFATGFWQSKLRYRRDSEILSVVLQHQQRQLPLSAIFVDFFHWVHFGDWSFDPKCWHVPSLMSALSDAGVQLLVSVWPYAQVNSSRYHEMASLGYLVRHADGSIVATTQDEHIAPVDVFQADARSYLWEQLRSGYFRHGLDLFFLDADEPQGSEPGRMFFGEQMQLPDLAVAMAYPLLFQQAVSDGLRSEGRGKDDVIMLSRSAWFGSSSLGAAVWSGDIESSFEELAIQVRVAQNVAMSGIYWWSTDIGGFRDADLQSDVFQELLVRWFQFAVFQPIFRLHGARSGGPAPDECGGSGGDNEVYTFKHYPIIADLMQQREALRPYVCELMHQAQQTGMPLIRPMFYEFDDAECYTADDQYMFGSTYLVAPVTQYQATDRRVYLPALQEREQWQHVYTHQIYKGGASYTVPTMLADFPLFQRLHQTEHREQLAVM